MNKPGKYHDVPIGWLSPEGRLHECDFMDHIHTAEEIARGLGAPSDARHDDWLLEHGWVHLTVSSIVDHGWMVIFPYNRENLTEWQHKYLKPFIEDNLNFIANACKTDLRYEFEDLADFLRK